jgi:PAS domain-containing protein
VIKNGHSTTEVPSARLLLALLEKASEILAVVDAEGRVILESHNQTGLLGYETSELLGRRAAPSV